MTPQIRRRVLFLLLGALVLLTAGPDTAGGARAVELTSVAPQVIPDDATTEIIVTGTGFLPETELTLVGGGIYETGRLGYDYFVLPLGIAISGDLAFVVGWSVAIVDISSPESPTLIGESEWLDYLVRPVAVASDHVYVLEWSGDRMRVVDVSDTSRPLLGKGMTTCRAGRAVATEEALYLACHEGSLLILDLVDPADPVIVNDFSFGAAPKTGLAMQGERLFVVDEVSGLFILSIQDPFAPEVLGQEPEVDGIGVTVDGQFAYVGGSREKGLQVVDIRDPRHPRLIGVAPTQYAIDDPAAANGFTFSGDSKKLWVHDAREPRAPVVAYEFIAGLGGTIFDVERSGDLLAVADQGGLATHLFDVSRPEPPGLINQMTGLGIVFPGLIAGDRAYLRVAYQGARIIDTSATDRPKLLGCLSGNVMDVEGDLAYATDDSELQVWDVGNPHRPTLVGALTAPDRIVDITVEDRVAYAGLNDGQVLVVDVTEPSAPAILATIAPPAPGGRAASINVSGQQLVYLHVDWGANAVVVVDVADPVSPERIGLLPVTDYVGDLAVSGEFGYLASRSLGLHVIDLRQPASPALVATLGGFDADSVRVEDETAVVSGQRQLMVDISDPLHPRVVGGLGWSSRFVGFVDGLAYLAGGEAGLQVVRVNPPLPRPIVAGPDRLALRVPPGFSPGFYHVMALQPDGESAFLHNAVEVVGPPQRYPPLRPGRERARPCPPER
jgi:hypothetical protein